MKKFICLSIVFYLFMSCTSYDVTSTERLVILPVTEVAFPATFAENEVTEIPIKYALPDGCHRYYDLYYNKDSNTRTVAIVAVQAKQGACTQSVTTMTQILKFKPTLAGTYTFKFYKGKDATGLDAFYEFQAVVN